MATQELNTESFVLSNEYCQSSEENRLADSSEKYFDCEYWNAVVHRWESVF